jgi:hypothetical protein
MLDDCLFLVGADYNQAVQSHSGLRLLKVIVRGHIVPTTSDDLNRKLWHRFKRSIECAHFSGSQQDLGKSQSHITMTE